MSLRVIANSMPALHNLPRQCRKRTHALPNQKKCSRRAVSFKKLQHSRRSSRIRSIIKCNRHARPIIQSPQSRPKNLRIRRDRPPSIQTSSRTHPAHPKPSWINRHPTSNFRTRPSRMPANVNNRSPVRARRPPRSIVAQPTPGGAQLQSPLPGNANLPISVLLSQRHTSCYQGAASRGAAPPIFKCYRSPRQFAPCKNRESSTPQWDFTLRFATMPPVINQKMLTTSPAPRQKIPDWFRYLALISLALWFAAYWRAWGPANFLHLCDIAVILTSIGLCANNALLISSQAISSVLIDIVWTLDAAARLIFGRHLIGGTEYLFDATTPLWARLLSLFHIVLPFILLWSLSRLGYDRRAWKLQSAILLPVLIASRFVAPDQNLNFAVKDPFLHRSYGTAPTHLTITFLFLVFVVYFPTHLLFTRLFPPPAGPDDHLTARNKPTPSSVDR